MSDPTIARVHEWLRAEGEGFRSAREKLKKYKKSDTKKLEDSFDPFSWRSIKRRHPMYYWPQLVLAEIIKNSNVKQKQKIRLVLNQIKQKTQLYKDLDRLLREKSLR